MSKHIDSDYPVEKVFNNNIVLVKFDENIEKIFFGKGLGFGKKPGDFIVKGTKIDKVFSIENEDNLKNFAAIVSSVDNDFLALCEEIIYNISEALGEELVENIHVGLIDHLNFAVKRLKSGEEIQNPFLAEIETLYSKEFELATKAAEKIEKSINVHIPDGEIGFIALHIHSARNNGDMSNTIKYSFLSNTIIEYVEDSLNVEINRKSLDYARFITHIRFALERIMQNIQLPNELTDVIKKKYKKSYKIAEEIGKMLEKQLDKAVSKDEVAYIAMHIERFRVSLKIK